MKSHEAAVAWRLLELSWIPIGVICLVLALCLALTDFTVNLLGAIAVFGTAAVYGGFAYYNALSPRRGNPTIVFMLSSIAQAVLITGVMVPLTYIAAATALPLQDQALHAADLALGFDWRGYLYFVDERPALAALLAKAYAMIGSQILIVPLVLGALGRFRRLQCYVMALAITLIVTAAVSVLVPAMGLYAHLGLTQADHPNVTIPSYLDYLRDMPMLRDGSMRHLNLFALTGVVTFPSFHAASAVLYAWALWPIRWARPIVVVVNGAMLASTPIGGGHYLVDLIAGVALVVAAIAATRGIERAVAGGLLTTPAAADPLPVGSRIAPCAARKAPFRLRSPSPAPARWRRKLNPPPRPG
jgi:hypothetical protein